MSYFYYQPTQNGGNPQQVQAQRMAAAKQTGFQGGGGRMQATSSATKAVDAQAALRAAQEDYLRRQTLEKNKGMRGGGGSLASTVPASQSAGFGMRGGTIAPVSGGARSSGGQRRMMCIHGPTCNCGQVVDQAAYEAQRLRQRQQRELQGGGGHGNGGRTLCSHGANCMCGHGCGMCGSLPQAAMGSKAMGSKAMGSKAMELYDPSGASSRQQAMQQAMQQTAGMKMAGGGQTQVMDKLSQLEQMMNVLAGQLKSGSTVAPDRWQSMRSMGQAAQRQAPSWFGLSGGASMHEQISADFTGLGGPWDDVKDYFNDSDLYDAFTVDAWTFNGLKLLKKMDDEEKPKGSALIVTVLNVLYSCLGGRDIVNHDSVGLDKGKFLVFLSALGKSYHDIPYHNEGHACAFVQALGLLLKDYVPAQNHQLTNKKVDFDRIEKLYMLVSAAGHDAGHINVDNKMTWCLVPRLMYLTLDNQWTPTAALEKYHAWVTVKLIHNYPFTTRDVTGGTYKFVTEAIMGTFESDKGMLKAETAMGDGTNWTWANRADYLAALDVEDGREAEALLRPQKLKYLVLRVFMQACDVIGGCRPGALDVYYWECACILYELTIQRDVCMWIKKNKFNQFVEVYNGRGGPGYDFTPDLGYDAALAMPYYPGAWMRGSHMPLVWNVPRAVLDWFNGLGRIGSLTQVGFINHVISPAVTNLLQPMLVEMKAGDDLDDPADKIAELQFLDTEEVRHPTLNKRKTFWKEMKKVAIKGVNVENVYTHNELALKGEDAATHTD